VLKSTTDDEELNMLIAHLRRTAGWCSSMALGEYRLAAAERGVARGDVQKLAGEKLVFYALPESGLTHRDCLAEWESGRVR
jgi:hypothetical protein